MSRVKSLLGLEVDGLRAGELLAPLQISIDEFPNDAAAKAATILECEIPTFRNDLVEEVDLIAEIARRIGYDAIPSARPRSYLTAENVSRDVERTRLARRVLVGLGFQESVHLPFGARDEASKLLLAPDDPRAQPVALANPLADDQAVLRGTLLPALLMNLSRNLAHKNDDVRVFELRGAFRQKPVADGVSKLPTNRGGSRRSSPGVARRGISARARRWISSTPKARSRSWSRRCVASRRASRPRPNRFSWPVRRPPSNAPDASWARWARFIPTCVAPSTSERARSSSSSTSTGCRRSPPRPRSFRKSPDSPRRSAMLRWWSTRRPKSARCFRSRATRRRKISKAVEVFDLYEGDKIAAGKKSVALNMRWRAAEKTLTDDEANSLQEKLVTSLVQQFKAERRT